MVLKEARHEKLKEEVESVTFHPQTNSRNSSRDRNMRTEDVLIKYGEIKEEKLAMKRRQKSE